MTALFRDLLGLEIRRNDPGWSILQLPTGRFDFVEVYGAGFDDQRLAPADVPLFVAFIVDDVESAHAEARAYGAQVGDIVWPEELFGNAAYAGLGWFFLHAPDGNVYVIQQANELAP